MTERDTFVTVADGDQLNDGYFNGIQPVITAVQNEIPKIDDSGPVQIVADDETSHSKSTDNTYTSAASFTVDLSDVFSSVKKMWILIRSDINFGSNGSSIKVVVEGTDEYEATSIKDTTNDYIGAGYGVLSLDADFQRKSNILPVTLSTPITTGLSDVVFDVQYGTGGSDGSRSIIIDRILIIVGGDLIQPA